MNKFSRLISPDEMIGRLYGVIDDSRERLVIKRLGADRYCLIYLGRSGGFIFNPGVSLSGLEAIARRLGVLRSFERVRVLH